MAKLPSLSSVIKNISISDAVSGQIVFQRVYAWKASSAFSNLGSLIQVFYQFAREVDDGEIRGIDFEVPQKNVIRRKREDILQLKNMFRLLVVSIRQAFEASCMVRLHHLRTFPVDKGGISNCGQEGVPSPTNLDFFPAFVSVADSLCDLVTAGELAQPSLKAAQESRSVLGAALDKDAVEEQALCYLRALNLNATSGSSFGADSLK